MPATAGAAVPEYQVFEVPAPDPQADANFGERLRTVGDIDADGARDVLMSSSNFDAPDGNGGTLENAGMLYVFSGRTRAVLRELPPPTPQAGAKFGFWSASLGDVDGDGAGDFVTSAPGQVVDGATVGQVYVFSGTHGDLIRTVNAPESLGTTGMFGGDFGGNLIAPGDLDGDGVSDFVATASGAFEDSGAAYAFSGKTGAFLYKVANPSDQPSRLGFGAAELGDVNADGAPDYQLGAPRFDEGDVADVGRSYIIDGDTGEVLYTLEHPDPAANERFGQADADGPSLGDITGDGRPDIYVDTFLGDEDPADPGGAPIANAGTAFLFDGATGALIRKLSDPTPVPGGSFGASNAAAGDIDGDGSQDAIVSSRGDARVTVFGGLRLENVLTTFDDPLNQEEGLFGSSISYPGDVNGDSLPDYFISSRRANVGGVENVGTAHAFISVAPPPDPDPTPPDDDDDGGEGDDVERVRPNLVRPSFARAVQRGGRSRRGRSRRGGSRRGGERSRASGRRRRSGGRIVVTLRGRMLGNRGRACGGRLKVGTRVGRRRVSQRQARMASNCRYSVSYSFPVRRLPPRLRPRSRPLVVRVKLRFQGNSLLRGDLSPTRRIKVRR